MNNIIEQLAASRRVSDMSQEDLARASGLSRLTVQRTETGKADPRLSTLLVMARSLGMELLLVPAALQAELQEFIRSGGRFLGQPSGVGAPSSIADTLAPDAPPRPKRTAADNVKPAADRSAKAVRRR